MYYFHSIVLMIVSLATLFDIAGILIAVLTFSPT